MAGELSKIDGSEVQDGKGMSLLYELTKSASIDCQDKVVRWYLINIYLIWSGGIMGEDWKFFDLDALEVFRIVIKWKKILKTTNTNWISQI